MLVGLMVELEQGATGTGNCQLHDLIPDALGVLLGRVSHAFVVEGTSPHAIA